MRIDLPVDAHLPPDYIASDRLRLEGYRRLASAADQAAVDAVVEELVDRYGPLPEPAHRLVAVARLRLLAREYGITRDQCAVGVHAAGVADDVVGLTASAVEADVPECELPGDDIDGAGADSPLGQRSRRTADTRS